MSNEGISHEEKKRSFPFVPDPILAVLIPIVGYYAAYIYEVGYAGHFGIPSSFVDVGMPEFLRLLSLSIVLYLAILGYVEQRIKLFKGKNPISRAIGRALFPSLFFLAIIVVYRLTGILLYVVLFFLLLGLFTEFGTPLTHQRKIKGYRNKLFAQEQEYVRRRLNQTLLETLFARGEGTLKITLLILLVIYLIGMYPLGEVMARYETSFLVLKSSPELVVLVKYSNKLICSEIDREKKEIQGVFYIKSLEQIGQEGTSVVVEPVGPLRVRKKIS